MKIGNFRGLRESLFHIGIVVFLLVLFLEHLFPLNTNIIAFFKGGSTALVLLGAVFLIIKKTGHQL
jgi:hypothetical protein